MMIGKHIMMISKHITMIGKHITTISKHITMIRSFVVFYFTCLCVMYSVYIIIDNTFWFLPLFWYFCAIRIEECIRSHYIKKIVHNKKDCSQ